MTWTRQRVQAAAEEAVACFRDEFTSLDPDWSSDWWVEAWATDFQSDDVTFAEYLDACKEAWA